MNEEQALRNAYLELEFGARSTIEEWPGPFYALMSIWACEENLAVMIGHEIEAEYSAYRDELYLAATKRWGLEDFRLGLNLVEALEREGYGTTLVIEKAHPG